MSYKILEANGVDNENVDGGALNAFFSARISGVVAGVLNSCAVTASGSVLGISPGLLILCGVRVKITEQETIALDSAPSAATAYQLVVQAKLGTNKDVSVSFFVQQPKKLVQDNLYEREFGTYQFELATFTHNTDGSISNVKTANPIVAPFYSRQETDAILTAQTEDVKAILTKQTQTVETALAETKEELDLKTSQNAQAIAANEEAIANNSAKIHNLTGALLEGGVLETVEVEQAYSVRQTADGEDIVDYNGEGQLTFPEKITGATVATTNLIPYPFYENSKTTKGVTFTVNSNGSVSVVGTPDDTVTDGLFLTLYQGTGSFLSVGKQYTMSDKVDGNAVICYAQMYNSDTGKYEYYYGYNNDTFTWSEAYTQFAVRVKINAGKTANTTIYPMLNPGDVAKPFSPYFAGLKNSYFKGIKSTGKNLIPYPYEENGTASWRINTDGSVIVNVSTGENQYSMLRLLSENPFVAGNTYILSGGKSGVVLIVFYQINGVDKYFQSESGSFSRITWKEEFAFKKLYLQVNPNTTVSNATIYPMLNLGSTALDDEPYKADEGFMLYEAVKLCKWDSITPESGEVTRATRQIVLDGVTNKITYEVSNDKGYSYVIPLTLNFARASRAIVASNEFEVNWLADGKVKGVVAIQETTSELTGLNIWFNKTAFTEADVSTLDLANAYLKKLYEAGKPLTVAYELATPTTETVEFPTKKYRSWNGGSETLVQGDTDNSTFGAMPTVGQEYFIKVGGVTDEQTE